MAPPSYALFRTPVGVCGIAWNDDGITGLRLPESDEAAMHVHMRERFRAVGAPASPHALQAIAQIDALLRREPDDLAGLALEGGIQAPAEHAEVAVVERDGGPLAASEL